MKKYKLPKHILVKESLKSLLSGDEFDIGEKIPGEIELCTLFNVSRMTLRRALSELQDEKVVKRKRGSGTVVLKKIKKYDYNLSLVGKLGDIIEGNDFNINTKMVKITERKAGKKISEKLDIDQGSKIIVYERVRSINGTPAVYSIDNIAGERVPGNSSFENTGPSLSQSIGTGIHHTNAKVMPVKINTYISELLEIPPESLCLCLEEITFDMENKPLDYSHEYYPEYLFTFKLLRLNREDFGKFKDRF